MTIHTLAMMGRIESMTYTMMVNVLETSMLSLFLNVSVADRALCEKNLDSAEFGLTGMTYLLIGIQTVNVLKAMEKLALFKATLSNLKDLGLLITFPAWREYIILTGIIIEAERTLFEEVKDEVNPCSVYWEEWGL